jgi:hypothetical protein
MLIARRSAADRQQEIIVVQAETLPISKRFQPGAGTAKNVIYVKEGAGAEDQDKMQSNRDPSENAPAASRLKGAKQANRDLVSC